MASEVGVLQVKPENVKFKGRLQPGRMFLVDFEQGKIIDDNELKRDLSVRRPYGEWLESEVLELDKLPSMEPETSLADTDLLSRMQAFGYTVETLSFMLVPLVTEKRDPVGSMGNDSALACLSDQPRMIYDYFKQLFAQVTNPAIDSIREEVVMALQCYIGPEQNLLDSREQNAQRMQVTHPILSNESLTALTNLNYRGWHSRSIDITFPRGTGEEGLLQELDRICDEATSAIDEGIQIIILTDRNNGPDSVPISALCAVGAVHHHLIRKRKRYRTGLVLSLIHI